jgi:glycolate oxidase iron-sulfur subunit
MRARLAGPIADTIAGARAEAVLRACVHCGMCNAVCPTFQLTGDELDGPRGRIYLMKSAMEGEDFGEQSLVHLDRCLECRACESACPSGVEYHRLLDVGRPFVEARVGRPWLDRLTRRLIRWVATRPGRFRAALALARLAPQALRKRLPLPPKAPAPRAETPAPAAGKRRMAMLGGCVQSAAAPHFNRAAMRVFSRIGVRLEETPGCCGALSFHLGAAGQAREFARRNIDAWLAMADGGAQGVVVTASGCATFIKDYPDLLADDPTYAEKARAVADLLRDPVEVLASSPLAADHPPTTPIVAVHDPCTLRHGLKLGGRVEALLAQLGYQPQAVRDAHLCCGAAGHYALTEPTFADALRRDKIAALTQGGPEAIVTANIGCWLHLAQTSPVPVRHWLEAVDEVTSARP